MRNLLSKSVLIAALSAVCGATCSSQAAVLYAVNGPVASAATIRPANPPSATSTIGLGDDYNTGTTNTVLTGLSFYGGLSAGDTVDSLNILFYDTSLNLVTTLTVSNAELQGFSTNSQVNTLSSSDFGPGISIPGAGYFIFEPSNTTGSARPAASLGFISAPTSITGSTTSDSNIAAKGNGSFAIGNNVFGPIYASVELDGTGTAVPEPTSLGLLASGGLFLLRRKRMS